MNRDELRAVVLTCLTSIAPEVDPAALTPDGLLRDQVDLDSVDWMNFLIALHQRTGIEIPDADVRKLSTLTKLLDYLVARQA
jgi:acyl carrier protein